MQPLGQPLRLPVAQNGSLVYSLLAYDLAERSSRSGG
jgi:hypothetical protein